jgi:4'-phosphopantetheinyl transferase
MCAVAFNQDIGADVERLREFRLDIVPDCFAPAEAESIFECSGFQQFERFFAYWTLKESYVKARGVGMFIPFDEFAFHLTKDEPPRLQIDLALDDRAGGWRFCLWRPLPGHCAALCLHSSDHSTIRYLTNWWGPSGT